MFRIVNVPDNAPELLEQLGTKDKFWFDEHTKIFKETRPGTGEDWAEKVAAELCALLGIPHAKYELAIWKGKRGVVTETIVPPDGRLILGNELLPQYYKDYPQGSSPKRTFCRIKQHTVKRILRIISGVARPPIEFKAFEGVSRGVETFVGYLLLDAWIGNQDRHHENWGLILTNDRKVVLAPTFDHGSSLGRNEQESTKQDILRTKDRNRIIERYVEKARSALYADETSVKPLTTLEAFSFSMRLYRPAALAWAERLSDVPLSKTEEILRQIPSSHITDLSIEFAYKMLAANRKRLLGSAGIS